MSEYLQQNITNEKASKADIVNTCPDKQGMRVFLEILIGGSSSGFLEIAYGNPAPNQAKYFHVSRTKELIEFAASVNASGNNVYVGPALRRGKLEGRSNDKNFQSSKMAWADVDCNAALTLAQMRQEGFEPSLIVTTGTIPEMRCHAYFNLDVATDDPLALQDTNKAIQQRFETDAVSNPGRIMRLAGSVSYPPDKKREKGYVVETTTIQIADNHIYALEDLLQLQSNDEPDLMMLDRFEPEINCDPENLHPDLRKIVEDSAEIGERSDQFHHAIGWLKDSGWSAHQIIAYLEAYPNGIAEKYAGRIGHEVYRSYGKISSSFDETSAEAPQPAITHSIIPWNDLEGQEPPHMQWVWDGFIPRGYVTSLYGDGGVGKTLLAQHLATCIAGRSTGNLSAFRRYLGRTLETGSVLALFAEDDKDELWRRQHRINAYEGFSMTDLDDLRIISGFGENNLLMTFDKQEGQLTELWGHLSGLAQQIKPCLIIVDNAADTYAGNEVDKAAVTQFLKVALGRLAKETGAAVLLLAHPSVAGINSGDGSSGSRAWNNSVRSRLYLERMPSDSEDYDTDVRFLDQKKANYSQLSESALRIRWSDGVFIEDQKSKTFSQDLSGETKQKIILEEMKRIIEDGENLSPNSRAGNYAAKRLLNCEPIRAAKLRKNSIANILDDLLRDKKLAIEDYKNKGHESQRYIVNSVPENNQ